MTKVFKKFIALFLFVSGITAPLAVVACKSELVDLANDVENLDLGYLSDLKSSTILEAFAEKNPRVRMEFILEEVAGNTSIGIISTFPPYLYYKSSFVKVTYRSKLAFDEGDEIFREINNKNDKCNIEINILDPSYDEKVDGNVLFWVSSTTESYVNIDYEIDRTNMVYRSIISLRDSVHKPCHKNLSIGLTWFDEEEYKTSITFTRIELKISLE